MILMDWLGRMLKLNQEIYIDVLTYWTISTKSHLMQMFIIFLLSIDVPPAFTSDMVSDVPSFYSFVHSLLHSFVNQCFRQPYRLRSTPLNFLKILICIFILFSVRKASFRIFSLFLLQLTDNEDIKSLDLKWLRSQVGFVGQEPVLFDRSIAENIAYGDNMRDVPMEEVIAASRSANVHNFITALPEVILFIQYKP